MNSRLAVAPPIFLALIVTAAWFASLWVLAPNPAPEPSGAQIMPGQLWLYDGKLIMDGGAAVLCENCPCEEPPEPDTVECSVFTSRPPRFIRLKINGSLNGDCSICVAQFAIERTLEFDPALSFPNATGCHWALFDPTGGCAFNNLDVHVVQLGANTLIEAFVDHIAYSFKLVATGHPIDPDEYTLAIDSNASSNCDMSAATAVVNFTVE